MEGWLVFDIETNGLLSTLSTIHSLCVKDLGTGESFSYANQVGYPSIEAGINSLMEAKKLIGHNIIKFDIPAIDKIEGNLLHPMLAKALDTSNLAALLYPDLIGYDYKNKSDIPPASKGANTLKAWGYRLGILKGTFGEDTDWEKWTPEMQTYCEQDVEVTAALFKWLWDHKPDDRSVKLEMDFQKIMARQEREGVPFNVNAAIDLSDELRADKERLGKAIRNVTGKRVENKLFTPKRDNRTLGYKKDVTITKTKVSDFNPNSRAQVTEFLKREYRWNPVDFTDKGNPKLDSEILAKLGEKYPLAKDIAQYLDTNKLLGMIYSGRYAWLKLVCDGRLHGRVKTNGAITGRCTHSSPNLAQVPSPRAFRGKECRELFRAPQGYRMVGTDVSGLELRNLAHYLYRYDKGAYVQAILDGDIHTHNMVGAGLTDREDAKTFIYAFLYGAGDEKLGSIVKPLGSKEEQKIEGRRLRSLFLGNIPGLNELLYDIKRAFKTKGYLVGLDGRRLIPRGDHSSPNTLIQSAGAVICKKWCIITWEMIRAAGLQNVCYPAINCHDEMQLIVKEEYAEQISDITIDAIHQTGEQFNVRCPLTGKAQIGNNWYETH